MNARLGTCAGAILLSLVATAGVAQDRKGGPNSPAVQKLAGCKAITDNAERLACYDREAAAIVAAVDQGELSVVDREQARSMRRSLFGFSLPKLGLFGGGDKDVSDQEITLLETTITSLTSLPRGRWQFSIAEGGARWETVDAPSRLIAPRLGQKVEIERAALGSYWIRFNGQNGVKGRRVN